MGYQDRNSANIAQDCNELGETSMRNDPVSKSGRGLKVKMTTTCEVMSKNGVDSEMEDGRLGLQRSKSTRSEQWQAERLDFAHVWQYYQS